MLKKLEEEEKKNKPHISGHFDGNQIPEYIMTHYEKSPVFISILLLLLLLLFGLLGNL